MTVPYVTANCQGGACSACLFPAGCAHECHRDKAARAVEVVPDPMVTAPNPAWEAEVERRGEKLCLGAEPHGAGVAPCAIHGAEARRGLFEAWLNQQRDVA